MVLVYALQGEAYDSSTILGIDRDIFEIAEDNLVALGIYKSYLFGGY